MELKDQVMDLICKTLDVKEQELSITEKLYDSTGVDSTEMVELVVALNKNFGIKIETNEVTKFSTPQAILEVVEKKRTIASSEL